MPSIENVTYEKSYVGVAAWNNQGWARSGHESVEFGEGTRAPDRNEEASARQRSMSDSRRDKHAWPPPGLRDLTGSGGAPLLTGGLGEKAAWKNQQFRPPPEWMAG